MGHKAVQEGVKLPYDFLGGSLAFLPCMVGVIAHEQFPVVFFCLLYRLALFKVVHSETS
jgi:hypothetical protein